jgi:hypothetical protein
MLGVVTEAYRVLGGDRTAPRLASGTSARTSAGLAESQMRWFRSHVEEPFLASGAPQPEIAPVVTETASRPLPLAHRAVVLGYRRHLEHYTVEDVIQNVEVALERAGLTSPGRRHPGIGFVDLTGYTALTEEHGDAAAADLADQLADVVRETVGERGGRAVKLLGDGPCSTSPSRWTPSGADWTSWRGSRWRGSRGGGCQGPTSASTPARWCSGTATTSGGRSTWLPGLRTTPAPARSWWPRRSWRAPVRQT